MTNKEKFLAGQHFRVGNFPDRLRKYHFEKLSNGDIISVIDTDSRYEGMSLFFACIALVGKGYFQVYLTVLGQQLHLKVKFDDLKFCSDENK